MVIARSSNTGGFWMTATFGIASLSFSPRSEDHGLAYHLVPTATIISHGPIGSGHKATPSSPAGRWDGGGCLASGHAFVNHVEIMLPVVSRVFLPLTNHLLTVLGQAHLKALLETLMVSPHAPDAILK